MTNPTLILDPAIIRQIKLEILSAGDVLLVNKKRALLGYVPFPVGEGDRVAE